MSRPLALTFGEPAGIGPDLILRAWARRREHALPPFYTRADPEYLGQRARMLGVDVPMRQVTPAEASSAFDAALPVVPLEHSITAPPGRPDSTSAPAAIASIRDCVRDVLAGDASAIVTNPIAKSVLYEAGFSHPGHTEYLAHLAAEFGAGAAHPVMMLWSPMLAVVPVTIHVPLREVPRLLTPELIVATAEIVVRDLQRRFRIPAPRLALSGLNPHAGENGTIGAEDDAIIAPAVQTLRGRGHDIRGPLPADTMFTAAMRQSYDAALCMYHDQALIPIKALAFDEAVNVTLGLPFVRTSPDHGTAFDIAGTERASATSLIASLHLAARIAASEQASSATG